MSGAIIPSFPQAPLVVPKLVARPMEQQPAAPWALRPVLAPPRVLGEMKE